MKKKKSPSPAKKNVPTKRNSAVAPKKAIALKSKLTKQLEAELLKAYYDFWKSNLSADMEKFSSYLVDDFSIFGSANGEVFFSKRDAVKFYTATADEMRGKAELRNRNISMQPLDLNSVIVREESNLYVLIGNEWTFYGHARISCVVKHIDGSWKAVHQHASFPDHRTEEGQQLASEKIEKENLELRDAVKRRTIELENKTHELEIEASLERVRTVAMGMTKPEDMLKICRVISEQLQQFGVAHIRNVQTVIINEEKGTYHNYQYFMPYKKELLEVTEYHKNPVTLELANRMLESADGFFTGTLTGDVFREWRTYRKQDNQLLDPLLDEIESVHYHFYSIGPCGLGITLYRPLNEEGLEIFKRFHQVFSLAYQRFRDIEQAEAQAREVQIELSLERVRAVAMSMQKSGDLLGICEVLFTELHTLGFTELRNAMINIYDDEKTSFLNYDYSEDAGKIITNHLYNSHPVIQKQVRQIRSARDAFSETVFTGKNLKDWKKFRKEKGEPDDPKVNTIESLYYYFYSIGTGAIGISTFNSITEEKRIVLKRFRNVFDLAYRRYTDIEKAEAQARDSQIEAALERVRAQTMAMHNSEDVGKCIIKMFAELTALGVHEGTRFGIGILNHDNENNQLWTAKKDGEEVRMHIGNLDMASHPLLKSTRKAWKAQVPLHQYVLEGDDLLHYYQMLNNAPDYKIQIPLEKLPERELHYGFIFEHGFFYAFTPHEFQPDLIHIIQRFSSLFAQTYRRYLDLVKAEGQAREAEIELALERVRARTMAMQHSDELTEASEVLDQQVRALGIETWGSAFHIYADDVKGDYEWFSSREGKLPFYKTPREKFFLKFYEKGKAGETFHVEEFLGEDCKAHYEYLMTLPVTGDALREIVTSGGSLPDSQYDHVAFFKHGYVLFITYEPVHEAHEIFKRFAKVFEQTYTRFLDLQKAEAQAKEAQIETALEKVRSRTMAMQSSNELQETAAILFQEFKKLGADDVYQVTIGIYNEEEGLIDFRVTSWTGNGEQESRSFNLNMNEPTLLQPAVAAWKANKKSLVIDLTGDALEGWISYRNKMSGVTISSEDSGGRRVISLAYFSKGHISISTPKPVPLEIIKTLERFAAVFDGTYTRFLDLEKAEAQAREAKIEAALERVRSRSMAMHKSEELKDVIKLVYQQLIQLKINLDHAGFVVDYLPGGDWHFWIADEQDIPSKITHPYFDSVWANQFNEAKEKGADFFVTHLNFEEKNKFYNELLSYVPGLAQTSKDFYLNCPGLAATTVLFDNVSLYIENFSGILYTDEENATLLRFGKVFQQTYTRFLDLQKAEAQAREAQIEAALERVRSRSMAMHASDELLEVIKVVSEQFRQLGFVFSNVSFGINSQSHDYTFWICAKGSHEPIHIHVPYVNNPMFERVKEIQRDGLKFYSDILTQEENRQWFQHLLNNTDPALFSDEVKEYVLSRGYARSIAITPHIFLIMGNYESISYSDSENEVIKRFAAVFDQSYTRFLDLQKAETQAREAQIEAALERVRSKSMAMHSSHELKEVITVVIRQFINLGFDLDLANFNYLNTQREWVMWLATPDNTYPELLRIPVIDHPLFNRPIETVKKGKNFLSDTLTHEELKIVWQHFYATSPLNEYDSAERKEYIASSKGFARSIVFMKHISLTISNFKGIPYTEDQNSVLQRFAKVFEQTYTRFLDLQKAEAQAREAQIEAALERVRSRSLAMHKSEELEEVILVVSEQLQQLQFKFHNVSFGFDTEQMGLNFWLASPGLPKPFLIKVPYIDNPAFNRPIQARSNGIDFNSDILSREENIQFVQHMLDNSELSHIPAESKSFLLGTPGFARSQCLMKSTILTVGNYSLIPYSEEQNAILRRFGNVFEQAYVRFLDLQKAEAQAKEAVKQSSLDRVRGEIASMRTTADLDRITPLIWKELTTLGISFIRCGVFIMDEEENKVHTYLSTPDGRAIAAYHIPMNDSGSLAGAIDHWHQQKVFVTHWVESDFQTQADILLKQGSITTREQYLSTVPKEGFYLHFLPFRQGMLYVGCNDQLPADALQLVQSLADAFSVAYARYEDFTKLESAKQQIEKTLVDLKQTQAQLVQSEKMASLGELTAGIAHEIQNPLNFVNNFSEVSTELVDEMNIEIEKGNTEEAKLIAQDLKQNLEKINHHGKRAGDIVKGMLQHSRSSSGKKEPTDINALADEYLRLAYHGLRAKDKSFNATMKTDFDETIGSIKVIPQDIGRVILNLITNAFYVVNEKSKQNIAGYEPTVSVSTKKVGDRVMISVKDNGNGIPDSIKEKIFQPFFTTKPTGQGTGLGLSLSYDIVKAHGGELKVETVEEKGSTFIIQMSA